MAKADDRIIKTVYSNMRSDSSSKIIEDLAWNIFDASVDYARVS